MDDTPAVNRQGGSVEPSDRAALERASSQARLQATGVRYELRDPFAEVTYRTVHREDIIARADKLGRDRFVEVDEQGRRTTISTADGQWHRGPQRPARSPLATIPLDERDEVPDRAVAAPSADAAPVARPEQDATREDARLLELAERAAIVRRLNIELTDRYSIKHAPLTVAGLAVGRTEYRFRGDLARVAFVESGFRLATETNNPSVARSMVDVAQAREWGALRVSGHDEFRRMVWMEASVRGLRVSGFEPNLGDQELLRRYHEARLTNRIELSAGLVVAASEAKTSARGSGSRKTVLAAIEAVLVAQRVPEKRREAIMAAAADKLAKRLAAGEVHKVKVYDKAAPPERPVGRPAPVQQRARERAAPVR